MISLQSLVIEDGKFKKVYTIVQEYRESPNSDYAAAEIRQEGIHSLVTEDLSDEETEELSKALRLLLL